MIRKLTTKQPNTQSQGIEKKAMNLELICSMTKCFVYCGGLRDIAFDNLESLSF